MKKYIIVALCLAAVWGCSDDKGTDPVGESFQTINGIVDIDEIGNIQDTIGTNSINDTRCSNSEEYRITALPSIGKELADIRFKTFASQEVEITIETTLMSAEMIAILEAKGYGTYENFATFTKETLMKEEMSAGDYGYGIDLSNRTSGAYLVRVFREGDQTSCIPILVTK